MKKIEAILYSANSDNGTPVATGRGLRPFRLHPKPRPPTPPVTTPPPDDTRFSTVPLSPRSQLSSSSTSRRTSISKRRTDGISEIFSDVDIGNGRNSTPSPLDSRRSPKLAARTSTTPTSPDPNLDSSGNAQFLLQKLDQDAQQPSSADSQRQSRQGAEALQARFEQVHIAESREERDDINEDIDWDFWGEVMRDYHAFARDNSDRLARAIEQGIPHTLRGMMWQLMSASKDPALESTYSAHMKEPSIHEKAILRDLGRTFPHHEYFQDGSGLGQENLFNVLKAYSLYDTEVGYVQGLPFVVALLLLNMPDEEAFCIFVRLMQSYDLRGHFLPEMPGLQLRLFQFERLLEEFVPVLHIHFLRQGVKTSMYASQWFLTMFSYRFPLDIAFRIFDNCFATGIEAMFRFGLVLLLKNEDELLKLKFDEILQFLKSHLLDRWQVPSKDSAPGAKDQHNVDEFVKDAFQIRITPFVLDTYAQEWDEVVRIRDAHANEVNELRSANRQLAAQVKTLEDSLSQLNEDHCELGKQLVMAKLQHEDLEKELVRYKLLYADAMHQSDSMMSSTNRLSMISTLSRGSLSPRY